MWIHKFANCESTLVHLHPQKPRIRKLPHMDPQFTTGPMWIRTNYIEQSQRMFRSEKARLCCGNAKQIGGQADEIFQPIYYLKLRGSVDDGQPSSTNGDHNQICLEAIINFPDHPDVCSCARNIQTLDFAWETKNADNCNGFSLDILTLSEPTITIDGSDGVNCNIEITCPATTSGISTVIRAGATEVCGPVPSPLVIQNQGACSPGEQIVALACYTLN
ncbi:hypothetical protein WR25_03060 [Diploscapter pachys]|uniref:Uncharacterized protein n=1 Tax=Diploscapter pachys TaxID=2018661 RepID=A0A2A2KBG4_9BILA|nr:hypothetical protein WR25_03060 [Diploscapter pachys]